MRPWTYVDVQGTHVTSTWDEPVARTQLELRENYVCTKHATSCLRAPDSARRQYSTHTDF